MTTVVVQKGDTLWSLARRALHDSGEPALAICSAMLAAIIAQAETADAVPVR